MTSPATLSVIVPSHGRRELTLACLASLAPWAAEDPRLEVILADDASPDDTVAAVAAAWPRVRVLPSARAGGFSAAANRGLAAAGGELLLLLNSDTEVAADGARRLRAAFAERPRLGAAGAALRYPDGRPQWSGGRFPTLAWLVALASGLPALLGRLRVYRAARPPAGSGGGAVDWLHGAALALRRAALGEVGGRLDESYRCYGQDLDLCSRLRARGWEVAVLPEWRVLHHHGATIAGGSGSVAGGGAIESALSGTLDADAPGAGGPRGGAGGIGHERPALLWPDLLLWAHRHRGPAWSRRARRWMLAAVRARRLTRRLSRPFVGAPQRDRFDVVSSELLAAARALAAWRPPDPAAEPVPGAPAGRQIQ